MIIEFRITVPMDDYQDMGGDDVIEALWTKTEVIDWLDSIKAPSQFRKIEDKLAYTVELNLQFKLDKVDLCYVLLRFPDLTDPIRDYETVNIYYD